MPCEQSASWKREENCRSHSWAAVAWSCLRQVQERRVDRARFICICSVPYLTFLTSLSIILFFFGFFFFVLSLLIFFFIFQWHLKKCNLNNVINLNNLNNLNNVFFLLMSFQRLNIKSHEKQKELCQKLAANNLILVCQLTEILIWLF